MRLIDVLLLVLVLVVSAWIARGSHPAARLVLLGSSLGISAALFLPASFLAEVAGADGLSWLESVASTFSWTLSDGAHFVAFLWLAVVLWTLRPDLRGWRAIAWLGVLAVAAELVQGLTVERSVRTADVGVNLLGAAIGVTIAVTGIRLWKSARPRGIRDP